MPKGELAQLELLLYADYLLSQGQTIGWYGSAPFAQAQRPMEKDNVYLMLAGNLPVRNAGRRSS